MAWAPGHLHLLVRTPGYCETPVFPLLSLSLLPELTPGSGHLLGPAPGQQVHTPPAVTSVFPSLQGPQPCPLSQVLARVHC